MAAQAITLGPPIALLKPINDVLHALNDNDPALLRAAFTADAVMIDDFAPYQWNPPNAPQRWFSDLAAGDAQAGATNLHVSLGQITQFSTTGDRAYVSAPARVTFQISGTVYTIRGNWVFTFCSLGRAWKITSSSFADSSFS